MGCWTDGVRFKFDWLVGDLTVFYLTKMGGIGEYCDVDGM